MLKSLILFLILLPNLGFAQVSVQNDITNDQSTIATDNQKLSTLNATLAQVQTYIAYFQAAIAAAQADITAKTAINAAYQASVSQTAAGVNWDYFVTLEPQIPFSTWSKVANGINWTSIVPTLGISCGGITESGVNWSNWGSCEANGMTPGTPFGGYNTGIAAFWCGGGRINGTC